jgi:CubicO group peptidase (beta-lactamase class C family)
MSASRRTILSTLAVACAFAAAGICQNRAAPPLQVPDSTEEARIQRVASSLQQQLVIEGRTIETTTLEERMDDYGVPAVSVAVIDDGELSWARAWGVVEAGGEKKVTTETIFQAGSVSKPVAALLALALVDEGKLALGQPVNEILKSWKVPDNEFTRKQPVTLFHVLTHQAGFTPFAYGIPRSEAPLPGMAELLAGGIRDWPAVTVEFVPGSRYAYSNAGYCVLQLILEDVSGLSLQKLAQKKMFGPLEMTRSTFDEPLAPEVFATAAYGHAVERSGEGAGRVAVPMDDKADIAPGATGGMWTTPTDLALMVVEVVRAWNGDSDVLISPRLAHEFLTPQVDDEGLGIHVSGNGTNVQAHHSGGMPGFICNLVFYPNTGQGAVIMASSGGGMRLQQELMAAIAQEHGWPGFLVWRTLAAAKPGQLEELVGRYALDVSPKLVLSVTLEDGTATGQVNEFPPFQLEPTTKPDLYVLPSQSLEIVFRRATDGTVTGVVMRRVGTSGHHYSRLEDPPAE